MTLKIYKPAKTSMQSGRNKTKKWIAEYISEKDIDKEFDHALIGIKKLPSTARSGVYLSYKYYRELFKKIKRLNPEKIKNERVSVSNFKKFMILISSYLNPA